MSSIGLFLLVLVFCSTGATIMKKECLPWEVSVQNGTKCMCRDDLLYEMTCIAGELYLDVNRCMTYDNFTLYEAVCPYIKYQHLDNYSALKIPTNLSQINSFFCDPLNREGLICEHCKEGYGTSVLTFGYKCAECSHLWRGWLLYIFFQFVPITIFYLIIFTLQISIATTTMNCFVFYSQMVVASFTYDEHAMNTINMRATPFLQFFFKTLATLYEPWNLDFFPHVLPEFCISESIRGIHVNMLRYVSPIYFLFLIVITYMILKLNNFTCQVPLFQKLFKPFKSCMSSIRSIWNPKASVIDVIATLFLLSYTKTIVSSMLVFRYSHIKNLNEHPPRIEYKTVHLDPTMKFMGSSHIAFVVPAVAALTFLAAVLLLLICYPFKCFRRFLACFGNGTILQHIHVFTEKLQGHYKDGTDNSYDLRLFSILYLILRPILIVTSPVIHIPGTFSYLVRGFIIFASSVSMLAVRPYKVEHYSIYDGLLLALLGLQCILIQVIISSITTQSHAIAALYSLAFSMAIPQIVLLIFIVIKIVQGLKRRCKKQHQYLEITTVGDDFFPDRMMNSDRYCSITQPNNVCSTERSYLLAQSMDNIIKINE